MTAAEEMEAALMELTRRVVSAYVEVMKPVVVWMNEHEAKLKAMGVQTLGSP